MANKQVCLFCDGKGLIEKSDPRIPGVIAYITAMHGIELQEKEERERREADHSKLVASAKSKLSEEEKDVLGLK